jgi:hypothetical protein
MNPAECAAEGSRLRRRRERSIEAGSNESRLEPRHPALPRRWLEGATGQGTSAGPFIERLRDSTPPITGTRPRGIGFYPRHVKEAGVEIAMHAPDDP